MDSYHRTFQVDTHLCTQPPRLEIHNMSTNLILILALIKSSDAEDRTRVACVKGRYPKPLDYTGNSENVGLSTVLMSPNEVMSESPFSPKINLRLSPPTPDGFSPVRAVRRLLFVDLKAGDVVSRAPAVPQRTTHRQDEQNKVCAPTFRPARKPLVEAPRSLQEQVRSFQQGLRSSDQPRPNARTTTTLTNPVSPTFRSKQRLRYPGKENHASSQSLTSSVAAARSEVNSPFTGRLWRPHKVLAPVQSPNPSLHYSPTLYYTPQ